MTKAGVERTSTWHLLANQRPHFPVCIHPVQMSTEGIQPAASNGTTFNFPVLSRVLGHANINRWWLNLSISHWKTTQLPKCSTVQYASYVIIITAALWNLTSQYLSQIPGSGRGIAMMEISELKKKKKRGATMLLFHSFHK